MSANNTKLICFLKVVIRRYKRLFLYCLNVLYRTLSKYHRFLPFFHIFIIRKDILFQKCIIMCKNCVFFWHIFAVLTLEAEILSHLLMFWNVTIIVQFLSFLSNLSHFGNNTLQSVGNKRFSMCFSKCLIVGACMQIYFFWNTLSCVRIVFFGAYLRFWL